MTHLIERIEDRTLFAGGALDTTFGFGATHTTDVPFRVVKGEVTHVDEIVSDTAGRTYVAAFTQTNGKSELNTLQLRRLQPSGAIDGAFAESKGSVVVFPLGAASQSVGRERSFDIAVDAADRLVIAVGNNVYRLNVNGTLDASFGHQGAAKLPAKMRGAELALDAAGRIYVIGTIVITGPRTVAAVARFDANGQFDTTFQNIGVYYVPFNMPAGSTDQQSSGARIRMLPDGSVHVLTSASYRTVEAEVINYTHTGTQSVRFTPAGVVDTSYGTNGMAAYYQRSGDVQFYSSRPVGIRGDGSVVMYEGGGTDDPNGAGSISRNRVFARDGKSGGVGRFGRTTTEVFGSGANASVDFIRQADGSELVVDEDRNILFKVSANGTYDVTFNDGDPVSDVDAAVLQPDGTVVIARAGDARNMVSFRRIFRDDAPVATSSVRSIRSETTSTRFSVIYRGPGGVDADSITGQELRVIKDGTSTSRRPRLISKTVLEDGSVLAVYKTTDLAGGAWDKTDNGAYAIRVLPELVKSEAGDVMGRRTVGTLSVRIA